VITELHLPALRIRQGDGREVFSFAVDGKELHRFATVSRVRRDARAHVRGYQRPEVLAHVSAIRAYLESSSPLIPNSLVVAFDDRIRFEAGDTGGHDSSAEHGLLVIPIDDELDDADKPGWIVDGQQRAAAMRDARVETFPVFVSAFVTKNEADQRSQFILVNSTKPLPKGLIHELLPTTEGQLPPALVRRRFPAYLLERLNYDVESPMRHRIRTPTHPDGVIKDNSVLKMLENSLTDGVLYAYRDPETGHGDVEAMLTVLRAFWDAVAGTFEDAWDESPRRSRLVHGAGIVSLGFFMDTVGDGLPSHYDELVSEFARALTAIEHGCAWTNGHWQFGVDDRRKWNEVQNTPRDIQRLSSHLVTLYYGAPMVPAA
jgi:DGQHR domain-containing protein